MKNDELKKFVLLLSEELNKPKEISIEEFSIDIVSQYSSKKSHANELKKFAQMLSEELSKPKEISIEETLIDEFSEPTPEKTNPNDNLKKFAQMLSEELKKPKEISIIAEQTNSVEVSPINVAPQDADKTIHLNDSTIVPENNSNHIDEITINPANIEKQRWADPLVPLDQKFVTVKDMNDHYTKFLARIQQQMSTIGGGGEVKLRYLDDVDRSSIFDMRYLRYNNTKKKFEFAEVNQHDVVYTTNLVETSTYTVNDEDYYVGVNYNGPVTITLPLTPSSGRIIVIKDESGDAETNPITVLGTVDNDSGGFIIQLNNGAIQMIYRNGWRII